MNRYLLKRIVAVSIACITVATLVTGCGKKSNSATKEVDYNIDDYVKLGDYKTLSTDEKITTVTDMDVQDQLDTLVNDKVTYNPITDRNAQATDKVVIDYTRTVTGKDPESKTDVSVEIGSGTIGEEFENHLVGLAINGNITFTISEQDTNSTTSETTDGTEGSSALVDATYNVTLKSIQEKIVPEVTDEFIAANSSYTTLAEYMAGERQTLEEQNAKSAKETAQQDLLTQVTDASTINDTPAFIYNLNYNSICQSYASYAAQFSMTLDDYLKAVGSSLDDMKLQAVGMTKQSLVIEAIAKAEGLEITDERFKEKLEGYAKEYNYSSTDEIEDKFTKTQLTMDMTKEDVLDYLYTNSTVTQSYVTNEDSSTVSE